MKTIEQLVDAATDNYFLWLDTDGRQGDDCGALYQWCDNEDCGDVADVREKLTRYYNWGHITREELESYAS